MPSHHPDASKLRREAATCRDFMFADMLAAVPPSTPNTYEAVRDALIDVAVGGGSCGIFGDGGIGRFSIPSVCDLAHDVVKARESQS